jgi:hypothetical protein
MAASCNDCGGGLRFDITDRGCTFRLAFAGLATGHLLPGLIAAIAALVCCLLLDQLNKERFSKSGSTIHGTIKALRRWPDRVEE